jgi:hypothetical protein
VSNVAVQISEIDASNVIPLPGYEPCDVAGLSMGGVEPCSKPAAPGDIWVGDHVHSACEGHFQAIASGYVDPDELTWIHYGTHPQRSGLRGGAA